MSVLSLQLASLLLKGGSSSGGSGSGYGKYYEKYHPLVNPFVWWKWDLNNDAWLEKLKTFDSATLVDLLWRTTEQARFDCSLLPPLSHLILFFIPPWACSILDIVFPNNSLKTNTKTTTTTQQPANKMISLWSFCDSNPLTTTVSDWTIQVAVSADSSDDDDDTMSDNSSVYSDDPRNGSCTSYHVHQNILTTGERKSFYFEALFRNSATGSTSCPNHSRRSSFSTFRRFELDPLAASVFPDLLDYMYGGPLKITTETAMAWLYLSEYLDIPALKVASLAFCDEDVRLETVDTYIEQTAIYYNKTSHTEIILKSIANVFLREWIDWCPSRLILLTKQPPAFLVSLLIKVVKLAQQEWEIQQQKKKRQQMQQQQQGRRGNDETEELIKKDV